MLLAFIFTSIKYPMSFRLLRAQLQLQFHTFALILTQSESLLLKIVNDGLCARFAINRDLFDTIIIESMYESSYPFHSAFCILSVANGKYNRRLREEKSRKKKN